ncbi:unnamed protein product [Trypanosoma congolense IL3000]|uniref:WGS project CAEQ00000000 data, annotated contig 524 n=1 Tax=Trypanosoma congolense (strain IL3000) TaxID=1068625 RepID=F9WGP0_TRYCI|nr:unnamed protein product [Trypanosoma congolense IL3000]
MSSAAPNPVPAGTEPVELTAVGCKGNDEQRHDTNPNTEAGGQQRKCRMLRKGWCVHGYHYAPGRNCRKCLQHRLYNRWCRHIWSARGFPEQRPCDGHVLPSGDHSNDSLLHIRPRCGCGPVEGKHLRGSGACAARKVGRILPRRRSCIHGFSGCVAYVISTGDILHATLKNSSASDFLKTTAGNRLLTFIMWLCCMLPLVIPRHIDSLRHASTVAFVLMIYMVAVVVVHSCMNGLPENIKSVSVGRNESAEVVLFNSGNTAIEGLGVFIFAYVCQTSVYEVYMDMKDRSVRKLVIATIIAMSMCLPMYALTALFGYLDFGSKATSSILLMYDPLNEPEVMVGYVGVLVMLFVSYALLGMSCRNALYSLIGWDANTVAFWKHCIAVVSLSVVMLVCGLFIPKINTVLGFAGSISGAFLAFIFPALFLMYSGGFTLQKVGPLCYTATYVLLLSGVIAAVFGTGATIYGVVVG